MKCRGRSRGKVSGGCVKNAKKWLGLQHEWAIFRDMWREFI